MQPQSHVISHVTYVAHPFISTAFIASIVVWHENDRLHLSQPVDRAVLYFHVRNFLLSIFKTTSYRSNGNCWGGRSDTHVKVNEDHYRSS